MISTDNTYEPEEGSYLIAQEVESTVQGRKASSTYTTEAGIRGMIIHMLGGKETCTKGAIIQKVAI